MSAQTHRRTPSPSAVLKNTLLYRWASSSSTASSVFSTPPTIFVAPHPPDTSPYSHQDSPFAFSPPPQTIDLCSPCAHLPSYRFPPSTSSPSTVGPPVYGSALAASRARAYCTPRPALPLPPFPPPLNSNSSRELSLNKPFSSCSGVSTRAADDVEVDGGVVEGEDTATEEEMEDEDEVEQERMMREALAAAVFTGDMSDWEEDGEDGEDDQGSTGRRRGEL